jgi:hypothetical protein
LNCKEQASLKVIEVTDNLDEKTVREMTEPLKIWQLDYGKAKYPYLIATHSVQSLPCFAESLYIKNLEVARINPGYQE